MITRSGWILLSVFVVFLGVEIGGGIYEALVLVPLWSSAPPASLITYGSQPMPPNPGPRFWMFMTPMVGLLSILNLVFAWKSTAPRRKPWLLGSALALFVVVVTFIYFVPTLLTFSHAAEMPAETVANNVLWWVRLNWVRAVVYVTAWFLALRAFSYGGPPAGASA